MRRDTTWSSAITTYGARTSYVVHPAQHRRLAHPGICLAAVDVGCWVGPKLLLRNPPFVVESKKTINTVIKADSLTQTLDQNPLTGGEIDAGPHSSVHVCTRLPVLIWLVVV
jgi:hypothetical protein